MNMKLCNLLMFATGAAIGSLVTWKIMKTRCERLIQEEVDAFVEDWTTRERKPTGDSNPGEGDDEWDDDEDDDDDEDEDFEDSVITEYSSIARRYKNDEEGGEDEVPYINGPYVISPDEFGDTEFDHELHYINYYSDGVLADSWGVKMDIDDTIGVDTLEHIGDHADDILHVRNERLRIDYEITCDPRSYDEAMAE